MSRQPDIPMTPKQFVLSRYPNACYLKGTK